MNGGGAFYAPSTPHMTISHTYAAPAPATSSATLNSILTTTASPRVAARQFQQQSYQQRRHPESPTTIPAKRKVRDMSQSPIGTTYQLDDHLRTSRQNNGHSTSSNGDVSSEAVDCICGFAIDDGYSIACDLCSRWCHSACFGFAPDGPVPDAFLCWACSPRSQHDKENAIALQRQRLGTGLLGSSGVGLGLGFGTNGEDVGRQRGRRISPSTERKGRRGSTVLPEGAAPARKRRRPSVVQPAALPSTPVPTAPPQPPTWPFASSSHTVPTPTLLTNGVVEEEHVDIDTEPYTSTYVPITRDIIPDDETRSKLRRQARAWRGITAVSSTPLPPFASTDPAPPQHPPSTPPITIRPLRPSPSPLLPYTNTLCLPPSYAAYTTRSLPSSSMLVPFHSVITPSSSYLREPTNGYAGLGMPKPHVHLLGPPLGVALDARGVGNEGRFVRWGCRPNAVLRPVICREGVAEKGGIRWEKTQEVDVVDEDATEDEDMEADQERRSRRRAEKSRVHVEEEDKTLGFAVFALRDLKEGEEVVLGWEWDDGHAIHRLPALLKTPHMFPTPHSKQSPAELIHLRNQLSNILHALASTFTTCACGSSTKDCAVVAMAKVLDRLEEAGANISDWAMSDFNNDGRSDPHATEDEGRQERNYPIYHDQSQQRRGEVDLGPLVGKERGFQTRERIPFSGGLGGMEEVGGEDDSRRKLKAKTGEVEVQSGRKKFIISASPTPPKGRSDYNFPVISPEHPGKTKGKERAVDVDVVDNDDMESRRSTLFSDPHADVSSHIHVHTSSSPTASHAQPSLEPRPPDPPDDHQAFPALPEDKIPPKMRKKRLYRQQEARKEQRSKGAMDVNNLLHPSPPLFENKGIGLGIHFPEEENNQRPPIPSPPPGTAHHDLQANQPDQLDHKDAAHQDDREHTAEMPPPPIPPSRDPAATPSHNASPTSATASPPSPELATPSPQTNGGEGRTDFAKIMQPDATHEESDEHVRGDVHIFKHRDQDRSDEMPQPVENMLVSPVHGFSNLSLMSPAIIVEQEHTGLNSHLVPSTSPAENGDEVDGSTAVEAQPDEMEDIHMSSDKEDEAVLEPVETTTEPQEFVNEVTKDKEDYEWSPLKRIDQVPEEEVQQVVAAEEEHTLLPSQPPVVAEPNTDTTSPLDSVASTPPPRSSPAPVTTSQDQAEEHIPTTQPPPDESACSSASMDMDVDDHTPSLSVRSASPPAPVSTPPTVSVPPPSHFFDTDDAEEWKRQMAGDAPPQNVAPLAPSPERQVGDEVEMEMEMEMDKQMDEKNEKTPEPITLRERSPSDASSRSATPPQDIDREDGSRDSTIEVEEPPPPSTATTNSEPPPASTTSSTSPETLPVVIESYDTLRASRLSPPPTVTVVSEVTQDTAAPPVAPASRQESQEPTSPAVQPKVKLSLRDFALRKKKMREEMEATKSSQASPISVNSALAIEEGEAEGGATPKSTFASPAFPTVIPKWVREPPVSGTQASTASTAEATKVKESTPPSAELLNRISVASEKPKAITLTEIERRNENLKAFQESTKIFAVKPAWLSGASKATEELASDVKLSGPATDNNSNVASTSSSVQPSAPPARPTIAPSTVTTAPSVPALKLVDRNTGYMRHSAQAPLASPLSAKEPLLLPPRPSHVAPSPSSYIPPTREAKKEIIDVPISSLPASRPPYKPDLPANPTSYLAVPRHSPFADRPVSPINSDLGRTYHGRRTPHEDGEIGDSSLPLIHRVSGANSTPIIPKNRSGLAALQTHPPPTGPRGFPPPSGSPSGPGFPRSGPPGSANGGASASNSSNGIPHPHISSSVIGRPPPPSAPRALRQSLTRGGQVSSHLPPTQPSYHFSGSQAYVPRGPSADRDRERERDWDHRHYRGRRGGGRGR